MKKNKAIEILKGQRDKLNMTDEKRSQSILDETKTYIDLFFGSESYQSYYFRSFSWYNTPHTSDRNELEIEYLNYLNSCIETIKNIGVNKKPTENWFSRLPNWSINLGLTALCFATFGLGALFNNHELKLENSKLIKDNSILKKKYLMLEKGTSKLKK